jgi:predicted kinase
MTDAGSSAGAERPEPNTQHPESDPRPRFYVMVGIPGSGKSTYARRHLSQAYRISLDDIRMMMTGQDYDPVAERAVVVAGHAMRYALARWAGKNRHDLLFDATDVTRQRRAPMIATANRFGFKPIAVYLVCPLEVALRRNAERDRQVPDDVIARFQRELQPPSLDEGFEEVIVVDPGVG